MKTVSLKLDQEIFIETEKVLSEISKSRNRYINDALDEYNKKQQRIILSRKLAEESKLVRKESIKVLSEFERVEYGD